MAPPVRTCSRRAWLQASALLFAAGCRRPAPSGEQPLRLLLSPAHAPRDPEALAGLLSVAAAPRIHLSVASSSEHAIDAIQAGNADAGLLSLFDFLFCADVFHVEPLVQALRGGAEQWGEILVRADAPAADLASLKGQRVAFVDRYSVTGFLLAGKLLLDAGIRVEPVWVGSHEAVLAAVRDRRVAAGATYAGAAGAPDLRALARTAAVANEPLFVRADTPAELRSSLSAALLALGKDEASARALAGVAGITGFQPIARGTYERALETVRAAGTTVYDLVPGGWARANEHRRPLWSYAP